LLSQKKTPNACSGAEEERSREGTIEQSWTGDKAIRVWWRSEWRLGVLYLETCLPFLHMHPAV